MGHRPGIKGGYFPVPPVDSAQDMRGEYLKGLREVGITVEKHHHEVAPSQHELGMLYNTLVTQADNVQLYKYVVQMVSHSFGKTATFMPKPVKGDNGSGMHTHQSIWKGKNPIFSGNKYAGLSETALHYIGGILKHAKAINAFSNATTNSYKRLIPGFEAPVLLAYSARNRSASCRIPITLSKKGARCEIRFPDAAGNPYLTFAAMLMAGLDGIKNKINPGKPVDEDLYAMPEEKVKDKLNNLISNNGTQTVESFHKKLGKIMWDFCGMSRNKDDLEKARQKGDTRKTNQLISKQIDNSEKSKALDVAMSQIEQTYGKGSIMKLGQRTVMDVEAISTGSLSLDVALGIGGLPKGRIVEIYGPESSGKTTLALSLIHI